MAVLLSVLQAVQYTGAFIESLSSGTAAIISRRNTGSDFILLALSVLLGAPRGLKKLPFRWGFCAYIWRRMFSAYNASAKYALRRRHIGYCLLFRYKRA